MSDRLNVASTIGTWIAAFIAIVALVGVLPVYVLYRKSRQQKARALAAIDDPAARFVSKGLRVPLLQGYRKIVIPDLRSTPRFDHSQPQQLANCGLVSQPTMKEGERSITGWVNFANLATSVFSGLKNTKGAESLNFTSDQSFMPMHRGWLILIGVLHRFAHRADFGLPVGSPAGPDLELLDAKKHVSGLSGVMIRHDAGFGSSNTIWFRIHDSAQLSKNLTRELLLPSYLCYLFMNLLPGSSGVLLCVQKVRPSYRSRTAQDRKNKWESQKIRKKIVILQFSRSELPTSQNKKIAQVLGLRHVNMCRVLEPNRATPEITAALSHAASQDFVQEHHHIGQIKLGRFPGDHCDAWIVRKDLYAILLIYLEMPLSPHGFLYNSKDDAALKYVVLMPPFEDILQRAQSCMDQLNVTVDERDSLQRQLEQAASMDITGDGWSRTEMTTLWAIDQVIAKLACLKGLSTLAVQMLWMHDTSFRTTILDKQTSKNGRALDHVLLNIGHSTVEVPDPEPGQFKEYPFSFATAFAETHHKVEFDKLAASNVSRDIKMPMATCVFACLRSHVRALMWKMSLSPRGLNSICTSYDSSLFNVASEVGALDDVREYDGRSSDSDLAESDESSDDSDIPFRFGRRDARDSPPPLSRASEESSGRTAKHTATGVNNQDGNDGTLPVSPDAHDEGIARSQHVVSADVKVPEQEPEKHSISP